MVSPDSVWIVKPGAMQRPAPADTDRDQKIHEHEHRRERLVERQRQRPGARETAQRQDLRPTQQALEIAGEPGGGPRGKQEGGE